MLREEKHNGLCDATSPLLYFEPPLLPSPPLSPLYSLLVLYTYTKSCRRLSASFQPMSCFYSFPLLHHIIESVISDDT